MPIIDNLRKLAEKVGADTNGRTIADQLDLVNKKLDETAPGPRDISEAVGYFADSYSGGSPSPTPETFEVTVKANVSEESVDKVADIVEMSHTVLEITTALNENKNVVITQEYYYNGQLLLEFVSTYNYIMSNDNIMMVFVATMPSAKAPQQNSWYITSDGTSINVASQIQV